MPKTLDPLKYNNFFHLVVSLLRFLSLARNVAKIAEKTACFIENFLSSFLPLIALSTGAQKTGFLGERKELDTTYKSAQNKGCHIVANCVSIVLAFRLSNLGFSITAVTYFHYDCYVGES
jgi:hypothetical protein